MSLFALLLHHARKDFRHLRPWLAVWGGLLVVQAFAMSAWFAYVPSGEWWWVISLHIGLVPVIQTVVLAVVVAILIQEESTADRFAYWLTMPIAPGPLLVSKLSLIFAFFILAPALLDGAVFLLHGFSGETALAASGEVLLRHLAFVSIFAALAALTPDLRRFGTWLLVFLAGYAVLLLVLATLEGGIRSAPILFFAGGSAGDVVPTLQAGGIAVIAGLVATSLQFYIRRVPAGLTVAVAGAALCVGTAHFLPSEEGIPGNTRTTGDVLARGVAEIELHFDDGVWVPSGTTRIGAERMLHVPMESPITDAGGFVVPERSEATLYSENRSPVAFDPVIQGEEDGFRLVNPTEQDRWVDLLRMDRGSYLLWRNRPARLEVDLTLQRGEFRVFADLELREGASFRNDAEYVAIRRIHDSEGEYGIEVDVRRTRLLLASDPRTGWRESPPGSEEIVFLLINRETGETLSPVIRSVSPSVWPRNARRLFTERISLTFAEAPEVEVGEDADPPEPFRDEDWLAEAVLAAFRIGEVERFHRDWIVDRFSLPEWE